MLKPCLNWKEQEDNFIDSTLNKPLMASAFVSETHL